MKRLSALSEKPKVRALAWVVCVVGLAFCVVCGQQVKWLSDQGGYQANAEENVLNATAGELLRDYTNIVAEEYVTAREVGRSTSDVRDAVEDEGFVFTSRTNRGRRYSPPMTTQWGRPSMTTPCTRSFFL